MTNRRDAQITIRLSADDRDALQAAADEADEPISQTARRAIRAFLGLGAVALALFLSGCGTAEPIAQPDAPVVEVSEPVVVEPTTEPVAEATDECYSVHGPEDAAWREAYNAVSGDEEAALRFLRQMPDPSEACDEASRQGLIERAEAADRIEADLPG